MQSIAPEVQLSVDDTAEDFSELARAEDVGLEVLTKMQKGKYSTTTALAVPTVTVCKVVGVATGSGVKIVPAAIFTGVEVPAAISAEMEEPTTVEAVVEAVFCSGVGT
jgi:hypothetical protein